MMGCDIHGFVEVREFPDFIPYYWDSVVNAGFILGRHYKLFSRLFGVRGNEKPIAFNRGLPKDYSLNEEESDLTLSQREYLTWKDDAHSESWISFRELIENKIVEEFSKDIQYLLLHKLMYQLSEEYGIDNIRLVVWFDN